MGINTTTGKVSTSKAYPVVANCPNCKLNVAATIGGKLRPHLSRAKQAKRDNPAIDPWTCPDAPARFVKRS